MDIEALIRAAGGVVKLAEAAGVRHPTVCDWRRHGFIPGSRVALISGSLDIPVQDLLALVRPPSRRPSLLGASRLPHRASAAPDSQEAA